ncbi:MAG: alanine--tRNA ligase [Alphaproteobacteria bacterium]|nr:alanine--tRNA ligase [Alphaproteobacteria bacterium]
MNNVNDIRSVFLDYFAQYGHEIIPSGPLIPRNDPTLMFTNAGMVQFKEVFTGREKRPLSRAAGIQKCIRVGGKHSDLENVGHTARHHTFFEMLGNFSFGDYFKDVAIELAWTLLTREFGLPVDRLMVTVYAEDEESVRLWKMIASLPDSRIIRISTSDNFWTMGDTGPCGPCSEIFFDHGPHILGGPPGSSDQEGDRFVELWNLVFLQFEQVNAEKRLFLPNPSIDTGMGLERLAAILQGTHDNYEIDLFQSLIQASVEITGVRFEGSDAVSHRIISDHLRASSFLIIEGVIPSNEGRGYILRRIIRRALRHAHNLVAWDGLMSRLISTLVAEMGQAYPELRNAEPLISSVLGAEESRFCRTLDKGLSILDEAVSTLSVGDVLDGSIAFKLYDTYGFPLDLTEDVLKSREILVDRRGFDLAMKQQRVAARKAWAGSGESCQADVWFTVQEKAGTTDFLGYETEQASGIITALVKGGTEVNELNAGEEGLVILNQTCFYGESGGQVGDCGLLFSDNVDGRVDDVQKKFGSLFLHRVTLVRGVLKIGQSVNLLVDRERRENIRIHHSATHLLHEALRQVLGNHVVQKGSLVEPGRLRFDFSHEGSISLEEIEQIEQISNMVVLNNDEVLTCLMGLDDAVSAGAMGLFGEKYGDEVRVVSMGRSMNDTEKQTYSMELCGGMHVRRTGEIGLIMIVSDGPVSSGIRRIEARAGASARSCFSGQRRLIREVAGSLKAMPQEIGQRVVSLLDERKRLQRDVAILRRHSALSELTFLSGNSALIEIGSFKLFSRVLEGVSGKELRIITEEAKVKLRSGIVVLVGLDKEFRAGIIVGVTNDLTGRFSALDLIRVGAMVLGGKGWGGNSGMAQSGGPDGRRAAEALDAVRAVLVGQEVSD